MRQEPVVVFVYRDERCAKLVKDLYEVLRSLGREARIRVVRARVERPDEFPAFIEYLATLYGKQYTAEYERYGIRKLPAVVVEGVKLVEGAFLTREQLVELLSAKLAQPAATARPPQPAPEAPKREVVEQRMGCRSCAFFNPQTSRCTLLRREVGDPSRPPCGRK